VNAIRIPRGDLPAWEVNPQTIEECRLELQNAHARRCMAITRPTGDSVEIVGWSDELIDQLLERWHELATVDAS
jgi:hypothetical protein